MKIYKFNDLTHEQKHSHFLQIVLKNPLGCARPDYLNDEDEFKFTLDYEPSPRTAQLLSRVIAQYGTTNYLPPHVSASLALKNEKLEVIIDSFLESALFPAHSVNTASGARTPPAPDGQAEQFVARIVKGRTGSSGYNR
jgi:hypothetical protein